MQYNIYKKKKKPIPPTVTKSEKLLVFCARTDVGQGIHDISTNLYVTQKGVVHSRLDTIQIDNRHTDNSWNRAKH